MPSIRDYINAVEKELSESFLGSQRPQNTFGRRNTDLPAFEPSHPDLKAELARCRNYASAAEYAEVNNRFLPVYNTDPERIKQTAQAETNRLMARWNHWNQVGLLKR